MEEVENDAQSTIISMIKRFGPSTSTCFNNGNNIFNVSKHKLKMAINQSFDQLWLERTAEYKKSETYLLFKTKVGPEKYLMQKIVNSE